MPYLTSMVYYLLCLRAPSLIRDGFREISELYRKRYNRFESLSKETKKGNTKEKQISQWY